MKSLKTWSKRLAALGMSLVLTATIIVPARADSNAIGASDEMTNTTSQENQGGDIITSVNFENANQEGKYTLVKSENTLEVRQENGNHFLYLERTGNINNTFFHLNIETSEQSSMKEKGGYVFEYDLRINELKPCGAIEICTAKNAAGEWLQLGYIYEDGSIKIDGVSMGSFPIDGEWHRLSIAFDYDTKTATCYVDRTKQVGEVTIADNYLPAFYRVGAEKNGDDISQSDATFSVDNCRIYQDTILRTAEQDAAEGDEEPTKGGDVILSLDFEDESQSSQYALINNGGCTMELRTEDENSFVYLERRNSAINSFFQAKLPESVQSKMTEKNGYVLEYDLRVGELSASAAVEICTAKDTGGNWLPVGYLRSDGTITFDGISLGTFPIDGEWHRLSLVFDYKTGTVVCYVDRVRQEGSVPIDDNYLPTLYRVGADRNGSDETQMDAVLSLDNFRLYQGTVLRTPEQDAQKKGGDLIKKITFSRRGGYVISEKGNIGEIRTDANDNKYLYLARTENTYDDYVDFSIASSERAKMREKYGYILSCDLTIEKNEGSIDFFSAKDTEGSWKQIGSIDKTGKIMYCGAVFGTITLQQQHRISLAFDLLVGSVTCYVDGIRLGGTAAFDTEFEPAVFRAGANSGEGDVIFQLDNFRLYQGTVLRTAEEDAAEGDEDVSTSVSPETFKSAMETAEDALKYIGTNDLLVMVNNGAYIYQKERKTSAVLPYLNGSTVMIPKALAESCFGTLELDGKNVDSAVKNGQTFLSLQDLCSEVLNKHFYWDDRGFAVASDEEFTLRDSEAVQVLTDPIDTIYRYLQFERPAGTKLASIIKEKNPDHSHPRLLGTAEDFELLKQNAATNATMAAWAQKVISDADNYIAAGKVEYYLEPGLPSRLLGVSRAVMTRMLGYSEAYVLTGDIKYADAAWRDVQEVCENYSDWNDYQHFLDTAEMAFGVAVAYDMFYSEWTDAQKAVVREAMIRNAFKPGLVAYSGSHPNGYWINGDDNWTAVCPGGLLAAAIAMVDEEDTAPYCEILLGETVQSFEYIASLFYPDGAWYESASYLTYTTLYMWAGINSLMTATGSDFGLLEAPGVAEAPNFMLAMHGTAMGAFNFHDGGSGFVMDGSTLWLANVLGVDGFQNQYMMLGENLSMSSAKPEVMLLTYDPSLEDNSSDMSLDQYFRVADTGTMRQNWKKSAIWAGVHAGKNGIDHDHLDLGEFTFEADGVRWVTDLGADDYNIPDYFGTGGYNLYRKRPEGNNCLVINPREGYHGQSISCSTDLIKQESKDRGAMMVFDLSNAYEQDAAKVVRGFLLGDNRRSLLIRDEIEGIPDNSEIYWFMNLSSYITDIKIDQENRKAVFTTENGKQLNLSFWTDADEYEIGTMACVPLATSPTVAGMADDSKQTKLYIKLKASDSMNLSVKLIPQINYTDDIASADNMSIADWAIPDGEIPEQLTVSSISLNGEVLNAFDPNDYSYSVAWPLDYDIPVVTAVNDDPNVQMTITQAGWDHPAKITLKSEDGTKISEYRITLVGGVRIEDSTKYQSLPIVGVRVSSQPEAANTPENAIDGDPLTRWSANGDGEWIEIDLGETKHFDGLQMAFYQGGNRTTFFDLMVSSDGENYQTLYSGNTSGNTDQCELYMISGTGRYIRFIGHYNSEGNTWISVNEMIPMVRRVDEGQTDASNPDGQGGQDDQKNPGSADQPAEGQTDASNPDGQGGQDDQKNPGSADQPATGGRTQIEIVLIFAAAALALLFSNLERKNIKTQKKQTVSK